MSRQECLYGSIIYPLYLSISVVESRQMTIDEVRAFIAENGWKFAKTYAKTFPHEYCVKTEDNADVVAAFSRIVQKYGVKQPFFRVTFTCFYFEGFKYWLMKDPIIIDEVEIINRTNKTLDPNTVWTPELQHLNMGDST